MKLIAIDGNSVLNRAFYGIRLLSTKDGRYTNGIYGFMNILLGLTEKYSPDAVCIAFDLKAPTFRHKMYAEYKAGRHATPPELLEQFAPLKELLRSMGYAVIEQEGYEADDILGTVAAKCTGDDFCYIVTGDRDSLQLISGNVNVLLASAKMGQTVTEVYDEEKIKQEYGVTPPALIDIKAVMGDSSDNIPGVAGIGRKGAQELITRFGSLDGIYENIDSKEIKDGMRAKLNASRDNAYLSRTLGTICREVPCVEALEAYRRGEVNESELRRIMSSLEMFKLLQKVLAQGAQTHSVNEDASAQRKTFNLTVCEDYEDLGNKLSEVGEAYFLCSFDGTGIDSVIFNTNGELVCAQAGNFSFYPFITSLMESDTKKYTSDIKQLWAFCLENGIEPRGLAFDAALGGYLLNPNSSDYSIASLAESCRLPLAEIESDTELDAQGRTLACAVALLPALCAKLSSQITENSQDKLLSDIEIPLAGVLADMEREGFGADLAGITEFGEVLSKRIDELLKKIYELAGCEFNVNSPKQLGEILFERLELPHGKKTKSGYSTNADVLEALRDKHPIIPEIFEYRTISKLKSTYCDGLIKVIDIDGRIHTTFNQTETRTGRISSLEPNLQNIPVRRELGRELRRFFVAGEGKVLVDADYSQIELRVLAHMADDKNMIDIFNNGGDIHAATAAQVFGVAPELVTSVMRSRAKAVNFGIVYGIGAFSLSNDIGVTVAEADRYIKSYLANFSGVRSFMDEMKRMGKERGYAQTLFGRRRYLPELSASNANIRSFGERVAMNMPIQGTAADIIKIAMIRVHNRLKMQGMESKLILQVHDELIIEAPQGEADRAAALLKEEMENACKMKVALTADVHKGKSWFEAKG